MTRIFNTLYTKPHNKHYLDRYVKFIKHCQQRTLTEDYTETHHIAPKAKDLFPELIDDLDNLVVLTAREHIIAHIMLWKTYGNSQTYAIDYMLNKFNSNTNDRLHGRTIPLSIDIRYAAKAREEARLIHSNKAAFKDSEGNRYYLDINDPLIQELNLKGNNQGYVMSEESKEKMRGARTYTLYKNDTRDIIVLKGKNNTEIEEYIANGWSFLQCEKWVNDIKEEGKERQRKSASEANKGTPFYYQDGSYYGRLDKNDPLVSQLGLVHIRSKRQSESARENVIKANEAKTGTNIWNNGKEEKFSKESPGDDWMIGRLPRSNEWETKRAASVSSRISGSTTWNDGIRNYRLKQGETPKPHWNRGMRPRKSC